MVISFSNKAAEKLELPVCISQVKYPFSDVVISSLLNPLVEFQFANPLKSIESKSCVLL